MYRLLIAGKYNVQAAQASNAAQAAYYEYMKTQAADNDFITQWAKISENYLLRSKLVILMQPHTG